VRMVYSGTGLHIYELEQGREELETTCIGKFVLVDILSSQSQSHFTTDSQSWSRAPSGAHDQILILIESYSPVHMGRPL
jgi:hypothetical protein